MNEMIRREVLNKYNTPMYLLDLEVFKNNYCELKESFERLYKNFDIAYSFKTNYTPAICKTVRNFDGYAEVVSELEYHMAKRYGFGPSKIIVNGPGKFSGIPEMVKDGALIMLDNEDELDCVIENSKKCKTRGKIGFRLNFQIGSGKESRFGFDALANDTPRQIEKARESGCLQILGLHFHLSGARTIEAWKRRAESMIDFSEKMLLPNEQRIIDLGSGMFGHLEKSLAEQFQQRIPSFREYAEAVAGTFQERYKNLRNKPKLIVEPGTTIVANAMEYITKVISLKTIRERRIGIVDGTVHQLGEIGKKKNLPIIVMHNDTASKRAVKDAEITGYTCLEEDVLYRCCEDFVNVGDNVVLGNAGAYSTVLKPPFIQPGCKIIAYDKEHGIFQCKREEDINDILNSYSC